MPGKVNHHAIEASIRIGKAGITDNIVKQLIAQLKKKKVVKVKFLPSAIRDNKKALVKELAERARARIIHAVGFIAVLSRSDKRN